MNRSHASTSRRISRMALALGLLAFVIAEATAQQPPKNFVLHDEPRTIENISFVDAKGEQRSLSDFRGKVILLNVWATWCGPCRHEMPSLDRLQKALGGNDFAVVALSIDRGGADVVQRFYADVGITSLPIFIDSAARAMRELAVVGVPATLLIGRDGREIGRLVGPAEWDAPAIVDYLKSVIAKKSARAFAPTPHRGDSRTAAAALGYPPRRGSNT